jgi:arabinofuranan 3-O-arabinosyltransferase
VLSQNPWRSVEGYVGHSWGVQLLALASVAMLAASTVPIARRPEGDASDDQSVSSNWPSVSVSRRFSE